MNLPNTITLWRVILVPVFAGCLLYWTGEEPRYGQWALFFFVLGCFSDAADGIIARKTNSVTDLGSLMDPLADKLLLMTGVFGLAFIAGVPEENRIPHWAAVVIISRDLILLMGSALIFVAQQRVDMKTNFIGKTTTVSQMVLVFVALTGTPPAGIIAASAAAVILTLISGTIYVRAGMSVLSSGDLRS